MFSVQKTAPPHWWNAPFFVTWGMLYLQTFAQLVANIPGYARVPGGSPFRRISPYFWWSQASAMDDDNIMPGRFMGFDPMKSRNITVNGRRTTMRLEPVLWNALSEIAERENTTVNSICSELDDRIRQRNEKLSPSINPTGFTSVVRVFIAEYFRKAAMSRGGIGTAPDAVEAGSLKNLSE